MGSALEQIQPVAPPMSSPSPFGVFGGMGIRAGEQVGQMPAFPSGMQAGVMPPQSKIGNLGDIAGVAGVGSPVADSSLLPTAIGNVAGNPQQSAMDQIEQFRKMANIPPPEPSGLDPNFRTFSSTAFPTEEEMAADAQRPYDPSFYQMGAPADMPKEQVRPVEMGKDVSPMGSTFPTDRWQTFNPGQTLAPPGGQAPSGETFYQAPSNAPYQSQSQTGLAGFVNPGGGIAGLGIRPDFSGGNSGIGQMYSPPNFDTQSFMSNTSANAASANGANPPGNAAPAAKGVM